MATTLEMKGIDEFGKKALIPLRTNQPTSEHAALIASIEALMRTLHVVVRFPTPTGGRSIDFIINGTCIFKAPTFSAGLSTEKHAEDLDKALSQYALKSTRENEATQTYNLPSMA